MVSVQNQAIPALVSNRTRLPGCGSADLSGGESANGSSRSILPSGSDRGGDDAEPTSRPETVVVSPEQPGQLAWQSTESKAAACTCSKHPTTRPWAEYLRC